MPLGAVGKWLRAGAVGAAMALAVPGGGAPGVLPAAVPWAAAVSAGATVLVLPDVAEARASRSSGGYSRPSSSRTPSVSRSSGSSRTPSVSRSSGYSRPSSSSGSPSIGIPYSRTPSTSDRDISRRSSSEALNRYREMQQRANMPPPPPPGSSATPPPPPSGGWSGSSRGPNIFDFGGYRSRSGWFGSRGWSAPGYAAAVPRSFGVWDGLFLWFMLNTLTQPGHAEFFHNHQNDPGYRQWRQEAERQAANDASIRSQLAALDSRLQELKGQPLDPNYLPPDTPAEVALAVDTDAGEDTSGGDSDWFMAPLIIVAAGVILIVLWRLRRRSRQRPPAPRSGGQSGMGALGTATNMLRHKLSGEGYSPSLFRVGMTITLDPTPFILASTTTKVVVPDVAGGNALVSAEAIGTVEVAGATLYRLYLPQSRSYFQLHLDANGQPDECRFFSLLDEVNPASEDEWGFWLDPAEGMIGWPEFQTKDGKLYPRVWAPGDSRIPPRTLNESRTDLNGTTARRADAMLYGAPTGAAAPSPETEYILVAVIEAGGQSWVEIHAGIDVNPAALSLA